MSESMKNMEQFFSDDDEEESDAEKEKNKTD
jgi:hypothetical protein